MKKSKLVKVYLKDTDFDYLDLLITQLIDLSKKLTKHSKKIEDQTLNYDKIQLIATELQQVSIAFSELGEQMLVNPLFDVPEDELIHIESQKQKNQSNEDVFYNEMNEKITSLKNNLLRFNDYIEFLGKSNDGSFEKAVSIREKLKSSINDLTN